MSIDIDLAVLVAERRDRAERLRESWGPAPDRARPRLRGTGRPATGRTTRRATRRPDPRARAPQAWVDAS